MDKLSDNDEKLLGQQKSGFADVVLVLLSSLVLPRKAYLEHPGVTFWEKLDNRLASIRKDAGGDPKGVTEVFRQLEEDQKTHGQTDVAIDDDTTLAVDVLNAKNATVFIFSHNAGDHGRAIRE
ncbi:hypothetical protein B0H14DRAFT_2567683 [Mycena olivaceomarginata]|nr:hypothetical protein B0H14DRAFT_2567683 [Mycena olivaceomarginata]